MGLDYLQKKNWHPGSIRNQEIVWIREELQKEIIKREQERAKKLLEEKHMEELKRLQAEAGLIPKSHLERMEWMYMYEGNKNDQQQKSAEEYLLGKPVSVDEAEKIQKDRQSSQKKDRPPFQPVFKEEITNSKCEDFSKLHEDPLFQIMQGEMKQQNEVKENPMKIQRLRSTLQQIKESKKIHKEEKKKKKEKKKQLESKKIKKSKKSKKKKSSSSSSDSSSSSSSSQEKSKKTADRSHTSNKSYNSSTEQLQKYMKQNYSNMLMVDEAGIERVDFGKNKRNEKMKHNEDYKYEVARKNMQNNAIKTKEERINLVNKSKDYSIVSKTGTGQFLQDARKEVYDVHAGKSDGLADRVNRNIHALDRKLKND